MPRTTPPPTARALPRLLRLAGIVALAVAALAAGSLSDPVAAHAAATTGSVTLSPSKVTDAVPAGSHEIPLTIANGQAFSVSISLSTSGLGQNPDGSAAFGAPADAPISFSPDAFTLAAGQRRTVPVVVTVPADAVGVYAAVLATIRRTGTPGGNIASQFRLASLIELSGPAAAHPSATISDISASGDQKSGHVEFSALIHNTGDGVISPSGTATILKQGRVLATIPLAPLGILPGSAVTDSGAWNSPDALDGDITVRIELSNPSASASREISFDSGAAPTTTARITAMTASTDSDGATVRLRVEDTGNTAFPATITVTEFDGHTTRTLSKSTRALTPGQTIATTQTSSLSRGPHLISATVKGADGIVLDQRQLSVTVRAASPALPIALGSLAVLLLAALAVWLILRRRRRDVTAASAAPSDPS